MVRDLSVLKPEYFILFKVKAYLDLSERKEKGEHVDSRDIKKHKNDVLRIIAEFVLEKINNLPETIHMDVEDFVKKIETEPFEANMLKNYGLSNEDLVNRLRQIYEI